MSIHSPASLQRRGSKGSGGSPTGGAGGGSEQQRGAGGKGQPPSSLGETGRDAPLTLGGAHAWASETAQADERAGAEAEQYTEQYGSHEGDGSDDFYGEESEGGGEEEGDDAVAVEELFGQVLTLQEQLQERDMENARLKQQLQDQKNLMQQVGGGGCLGILRLVCGLHSNCCVQTCEK